MATTWFTSDLHIGHGRVAEARGFSTTDEHDEWLRSMWEANIRPKDTVYVLGDVAVSRFPEALAFLRQLPGAKHLIAGNHDPIHPMHRSAAGHLREWLDTFETVQPFLRKRYNRHEVLLSHFPYASVGDGAGRDTARYAQYRLPDLGAALLHGHTHSAIAHEGDRQLHVGVDAWKKPVHQDVVVRWLDSLAE